jgi:hypothetical protein
MRLFDLGIEVRTHFVEQRFKPIHGEVRRDDAGNRLDQPKHILLIGSDCMLVLRYRRQD